MTMITLDKQIEFEEKLLEDTRAALKLLREEIEELREKLGEGDMSEVSGASTNVKKLNTLYDACLETDNRLGKCKDRKAGIAQNGVAFDLHAARDSIGCKLDRLRECCGADVISG